MYAKCGICNCAVSVHLSVCTNYSVPRTRTKFGDRAFSVAGPVVCNSLPAAVREADSLYSFKRKLKTHLFTMCFTETMFLCILQTFVMHSRSGAE